MLKKLSLAVREALLRHVHHQARSFSGGEKMASKVSRGVPEAAWLSVLRGAALIAVPTGAAGSVSLMLRAGRHNDSRLLLLLFGIWVLSPFIAALLANVALKPRSVVTRATLYVLMLVLTLGSLAIYGDVAFGHPRVKTGFVFLVVPFASWLLIAVIVAMATIGADGLPRRGKRG